MDTRLTANDSAPRLWVPLLFGVLGLVTVVNFVTGVSPQTSLDLRLTRGQALDSATSFMKSLGYKVDALTQDGWIVADQYTQLYLQELGGVERANAMVRADSLPVHYWAISWYDKRLSGSQNPEHFTVYLSPGGRVLRFSHEILDTVSLPTVDAEHARIISEELLARFHKDFSLYKLKSSSDISLPHRVDHQFIYEKLVDGLELDLLARVQGNEVAEMRWDATLNRTFMARISDLTTTATLMVTLSMVANFLLFFFVVILFLRKYHEGEVGTRMAFLVFLGYFGISVLYVLNQFHGLGASTQIGDLNKSYIRYITLFLWVFVLQMFMAVMAFSAWSVGESSSRTVWSEKVTSMDALLNRRFFSRNGGEALLRGYGWGFAILGMHTGLLFLLNRSGVMIVPAGLEGVPESFLPGIQPLLFGFVAAMGGEIVNRLFLVSYIQERTRSLWVGIVVSIVVWTFTSIWSWSTPFGSLVPPWNLVVIAAYGGLFVILFLRRDLLTALSAHFVVVAVGVAIPLFTSSSGAFAGDRWMFVAGLAMPLVVGVFGYLRGDQFRFTPELMPEHIQRISERVRMAKELEIARTVQMSLLPKEHPTIDGYEIAGLCIPAQEVGGDYFDFVQLGPRKLGIALGDVSGKGVPAAIYMTLTKGILQSNAGEDVTPKTVLSKVNSLMYRAIERNSFVSMLYAVLDGDARTLCFARAGQCPILLTAILETEERFLTTKGMALGLEKGDTFNSVLEEQELSLHAGDVMVFYTDGFTEAMNAREDEFGEQRLVDSVRRHRAQPVDAIIQSIIGDIRAFTGNVAQHDDMTIVVVKVL